MLLERITTLWVHAIRDAEAIHARLRPGYQRYPEAELRSRIHDALRRHQDLPDLLAELFADPAPVSLTAVRAPHELLGRRAAAFA